MPQYKAVMGLALVGLAPLFGQFTPIATPTSAYTGGTTVVPITGANFTSVGSLTDGTQTITFSSALSARTTPGGGWATWASPPETESNSTRVVAAITSTTTFSLTLSVPANTFGFEFEPNAGVHTISAEFRSGATVLGTVTRSVNGSFGARLFAASSATPISSVVLTIPAGAAGFGLAQIRTGGTATAIPASSTGGLAGLGILLLAGGAMLARKQESMVS
jgi:hypothetical protein